MKTQKLLKTAVFSAAALMGSAALFSASAGQIGFQRYIGGSPDAINEPITIACEAEEEIQSPEKYDLDPNVNSPLGNQIGALFYYKPDPGSLTQDYKIHINLRNAKFHADTGNCWLVADETALQDTNGDGIPDASYDLNIDGDTNDLFVVGYTLAPVGNSSTIEFEINANGHLLPNNAALAIVCDDVSSPLGTINDVDNPNAGPDASVDPAYALLIDIETLPADPGGDVCMSAEGYNDSMTPVPNLNAAENCFFEFECQFDLSIHPTINTINIYSPSNSMQFIDPDTSDILLSSSPTDLDAADGKIDIDNDSDMTVEDYIHLDALLSATPPDPATLVINLWSETRACNNSPGDVNNQALDFDNQRVGIDIDGVETTDYGANGKPDILFLQGAADTPGDPCTMTVTVTDTLVAGGNGSGLIAVPHGTHWVDDVYMGVNGDYPIRWNRWQLSMELTVMGNTHSITSEDKTDSRVSPPYGFFKKWEFNGTTFYAPWLQNQAGVVVKFAHNNVNKITGGSGAATPGAEVRAKVWDECGRYADNILVGYIPDQGGLVVRGNDLLRLARAVNPNIAVGAPCANINQNPPYDNLLDPAKPGRFSAIFRVGAPERDVEASAFQATATGQKALPIYQNDLQADDLRVMPENRDLHKE